MNSLWGILPLCAQPGQLQAQDNDALVRERNRETSHPSVNPIELIGREEGGAEFRSRTPILAGATRTRREVDSRELYERRLATYDRRASFTVPLGPAGDATVFQAQVAVPQLTPKDTPTKTSPIDESDGLPWVTMGAVLLALVGLSSILRR